MTNSVSVIIPAYGTAQIDRLKLTAESIFSQKGVSLEFIIAGLNNAAKIKDISTLAVSEEEIPKIVQTGAIINNGLRLASGEFTYVTDSDIIIINQEYLKNLIQQVYTSGNFLKRPPMRRLLLQDFDWFSSIANSKGLEKALESLDFSQEYLVKPQNTKRLIRVFSKFENKRNKTFIISDKDFQEYISNKCNQGSEPRYFNQDRHCGAVFATTKAFLDVGGYHEGFVSWGVWDADVQWKLEHLLGIDLIPAEKKFEVIHLDHPKGYFDRTKWIQDRSLQEVRRKIGPEKCVEQDIDNFWREKYGKKDI